MSETLPIFEHSTIKLTPSQKSGSMFFAQCNASGKAKCPELVYNVLKNTDMWNYKLILQTSQQTNLRARTAICRVAVELPESVSSNATMEAVTFSLCSCSAKLSSCAKFPIKRQARHWILSLEMLWMTEASGFTIP
jgi:hypothetical protein